MSNRLILPSLNALYTFEAVARRGGFARASDELNVTPAAVSRMIGRLESHIGAQLFVRRPGGMTPTEDGAILAEAVGRGIKGIEAALREIETRRRGIETVAVSLSTGFTTHWLMPRMGLFKQRFPNVELRFHLIMGALSGPVDDVDFGMRFVDGADERHDTAPIMPEILLPICAPGYLAGDSDPPGLDPAAPFPPAEQQGWSHLFFPRSQGDTGPTASLFFSDYAIVVQAALLGQGIALGWLNVVAHWLRTGALAPAGGRLTVTGRRCQFVHRRDRPPGPVAAAVRDWIIAEVRADVAGVAARYPELGLDRV
jgi:LysR family glycine cleavage system transcriptional activator